MAAIHGYYINLDERGDFYADVRDESGETVFEIRSEDDGTVAAVEDGFMADRTDVSGLTSWLVEIGVIREGDEVLEMAAFEAELETRAEPDHDLEPC